MSIRFSEEGLARQAALVRDVEPDYFAWIDRALRALPAETLEPIVSVDDLGAFVRGEGYADYWATEVRHALHRFSDHPWRQRL